MPRDPYGRVAPRGPHTGSRAVGQPPMLIHCRTAWAKLSRVARLPAGKIEDVSARRPVLVDVTHAFEPHRGLCSPSPSCSVVNGNRWWQRCPSPGLVQQSAPPTPSGPLLPSFRRQRQTNFLPQARGCPPFTTPPPPPAPTPYRLGSQHSSSRHSFAASSSSFACHFASFE